MNITIDEDNKVKKLLFSLLIAFGFSIPITVFVISALFTNMELFLQFMINAPIRLIAILFIVTFILALSYIIMGQENKSKLSKIKAQLIVSFAILLTITLCLISNMYFGKFARPIALAGIFIAVLINKRSAYYCEIAIAVILILTEGFALGFTANSVVFTFSGMFSGVIMTLLVAKDDTRIKTVLTVVYMIPVAIAVSSAFYFVFFMYSWDTYRLVLLQSAIAPIVSGFVYLGVLPLFEVLFKVLTPYYLTEITDVNKGLLFKLATVAPGTFNHSLSVANLAGACALNIGENVRLARACGYYHDIGKITDPSIFTENQMNEETNPHDRLTPELSVNLIKKHVSAGVDILTKKGFPEEIIKAAAEHHGTMPITYFYTKAKKYTDGYVDVKDYSYDGPRPSSKITAILMIVDASEAAVRSLRDRTREKIDEIVKNIIEQRMELEQFDACDITFKDLQIIRKTLVDNFAGVYHERIEYPKLKILKRPDENESNK